MKKLTGLATAMVFLAGICSAQAASQTQATRPAKAERAAKGEKAAKGAAAGLEGTRWKVTVTPNAAAASKGEKAFDDEFVFAGGKVTMTACTAYGFTASDYKGTKAGKGWSFQSTQTSATSGEAQWKTKMTDDKVKGTLTWKKSDGTVLHYDVEGKKI